MTFCYPEKYFRGCWLRFYIGVIVFNNNNKYIYLQVIIIYKRTDLGPVDPFLQLCRENHGKEGQKV